MKSRKHQQILMILAIILMTLATFREMNRSELANLPILEAAQVEEIEEQVALEAAFYKDGKLLINQADESKFTELPGIGPVLAKRISEDRNMNGPYRRIEDLRRVKGIGPKKLEALRGKVIFE